MWQAVGGDARCGGWAGLGWWIVCFSIVDREVCLCILTLGARLKGSRPKKIRTGGLPRGAAKIFTLHYSRYMGV